MTEEQKELLFDLLTKKAIYGLNEAEEKELAELDPGTAGADLFSLEMAAAAISLAGLSEQEQMPSHLRERILDASSEYVGVSQAVAPWPPPTEDETEAAVGGSWFGWLGWAAAAAACIALAVNMYTTRLQPIDVARVPTPTATPKTLAPAELREEMLRTSPSLVKASWAAGNVKELADISGDVVWSEAKQSGYMRFRGLPVNDASATTYQLWIFDKTQDKATPIDGGTFDVSSDGEVVIPINAKLKAVGPEMFAITIEKSGGVVVSKREKIAALAKVETQSS
ncbi:MAG: anti-sigma factor [Pyrinomonadaceae bacterium]